MKRFAPILLVPFLLATSGPLFGKRADGVVNASPTGASIGEPPVVSVEDNVNNQGCVGKRFIDLTVSVALQNDGADVLVVDENLVALTVDGVSVAYQPYSSRGETPSTFNVHQIDPGTSMAITFRSYEVGGDDRLETVDTVDLVVPTARGDLSLSFRDLRSATVEQVR